MPAALAMAAIGFSGGQKFFEKIGDFSDDD
jgi:hypothetical protein